MIRVTMQMPIAIYSSKTVAGGFDATQSDVARRSIVTTIDNLGGG